MSDKNTVLVYGDGIRDDTDSLQEIFNGRAVEIHEDGTPFDGSCRKYIISRTIVIDNAQKQEGV